MVGKMMMMVRMHQRVRMVGQMMTMVGQMAKRNGEEESPDVDGCFAAFSSQVA